MGSATLAQHVRSTGVLALGADLDGAEERLAPASVRREYTSAGKSFGRATRLSEFIPIYSRHADFAGFGALREQGIGPCNMPLSARERLGQCYGKRTSARCMFL